MVEVSREELIIYAKFAEQAERYEDMVEFMDKVVRMGEKLSPDERNLLSVAYKNVVGARRSSYRVVSGLSNGLSDDDEKKSVTEDFSKKIKEELENKCRDVLRVLDEYLVKEDDEVDVKSDPLSQVFYLKMKGDYFRYLVEVSVGDDRKDVVNSSREAYEKASKVGEELPPTNPIRLGLALNFSVFYYEIEDSPSKACELAKKAFDAAISQLDQLSEESYKDSTLIMQLLRDNLTLWTAESVADDNENWMTICKKVITLTLFYYIYLRCNRVILYCRICQCGLLGYYNKRKTI